MAGENRGLHRATINKRARVECTTPSNLTDPGLTLTHYFFIHAWQASVRD